VTGKKRKERRHQGWKGSKTVSDNLTGKETPNKFT
jgi:hypothetical protein